MSDFDVNEGYLHATARRADPSLPGIPDDGISLDGRVAPFGLDVEAEHLLNETPWEGFADVDLAADLNPWPDRPYPVVDPIDEMVAGGPGHVEDDLLSRVEGGIRDQADGGTHSAEPADESPDTPQLFEQTPIVRRTRHHVSGHRSAADAGPGRRVGVKMIARRRRLARRACPFGWKVRVLSTRSRHRRRLWTSCHGLPRQTPGSLS